MVFVNKYMLKFYDFLCSDYSIQTRQCVPFVIFAFILSLVFNSTESFVISGVVFINLLLTSVRMIYATVKNFKKFSE